MTKFKPQVKIVDCTTGEEIIRDATADEIVQMETIAIEATAKKQAEQAKEIERQSILARIGLTADELQTILG
jgi:hypothetical protein